MATPPDRVAGRAGLPALVLWVFALLLSGALRADTGHDDPFGDCESRWAAEPETLASYCFVNIARAHRLWDEAKRRVGTHLKSRPGDPYLRFTLGFLELEGGELSEAIEHFRAAAEAFADRAKSRRESQAWSNLGLCLMRLGRLDEVEPVLQRAQDAAQRAADPDLLVTVKVQQAQLLRRQGGDLEGADRFLQSLEEGMPATAGYWAWRSLLYERADIFSGLGRYDEARWTNERWAAMARRADNSFDEATAWSNVAVAGASGSPRAGAREEVTQLARQALESAERAGNQAAAVTAHRLLGKLLRGEEGRAHLEECLRLTTSAGEPPQQAACLFALAGTLASDDVDRARLLLDEAVSLALASEDPWTAMYGWAERFRVNWATRFRSEAAADSLAVLDHIETLRRLQSSESGRAAFLTDWAEVYHSLAGFLLKAPDGPSRDELETAFSVAERLRARVLLDSLAAAQVDSPPPDPEVADELTRVLRETVRVQRRLQNPRIAEAERIGLLAELEALERDQAELDARLGVGSTATFPEHGFVGLTETEEALAPHEALLAFLMAPDEDIFGKFAGGSWLLAVTSTGTRAYRLPGRMDLGVKVATFRGLVEARDDALLELGAVTLYDDLLAAALADLPGVEELILVPDGVLHLLPFGLLRPHPQADPLAATYRLSSAPSVTLWHRWREGSHEVPAAALALADPEFVGSSIAEEGTSDTLAAEDRQWALETGGLLGRLPYAVNEGRALVRRLGGPPSRVLIGEEATEAFLKSAPFDDFGVLHFAAHALVDDQRPRRSAVLLAAGTEGEDGLLQPREIAALDLAGKLVVVSACESGSGQVLLGEGVQSLARAFFRAGARAVVASLWRLEDDEAADFFDRFYRALADGESVAGAVAEAQRELRGRGAPAAAWAGVVVLGDGAMVPVPGGVPGSWRDWPWWWGLLLLAAAAVLGVLFWLLNSPASRADPGR